MSFWDTLDPRYRLILCDVWGVVHDGVRLFPGAARRLRRWRDEGRFVLLLTNAPRPASDVERQLADLGLPGDCWDAIVTSGEAGIAALASLGAPVGFLGTAEDWALLAGRGVRAAGQSAFADLACTGLEEQRPDPEEYRAELVRLAANGIRFHCLNPDRVVIRGGVPEACAGALADLYESLGGTVIWYGKPYEPIYRHALELADNPPPEQVLAVGDGWHTDMLGAARMGFDGAFVGRGRGQPALRGRSEWRPVAVVESLL